MTLKNLIVFLFGAFLSLFVFVLIYKPPIDECKAKGGVKVRGVFVSSVCVKKEALL